MQRLSAKDTSRLGQPDLGRECLLKNFLNSSDWSALAQGTGRVMTPDTRVAGSVPRVGTILPARVNPPHKTQVYPGWAIRSYYPLWAICGYYEFLVLKFSLFSLIIDIKL